MGYIVVEIKSSDLLLWSEVVGSGLAFGGGFNLESFI